MMSFRPLAAAAALIMAAGTGVAQTNTSCVVVDPTGTPLNVRSSPNGQILGTLPNGNGVRILNTASLNGKPWALVANVSGQQLGWVFRSYVACTTQVASPPPAAPPPIVVAAPPTVASRPPAATPPVVQAAPRPAVAAVEPSRPAIRVDLPRPSATAGKAEKRVALVVGNGRYVHAGALTNPTNDAADVAAALRSMGFDVVEGVDLDFQGFRSAVRSFSQKLDGAAVALFFYAGHGLQVGAKNYLVPIDAKLENAGDLELDAVNVDTITRAMEGEERVNVVMLDACRDNPFARSLRRSLGTRSGAVGQGLAPIRTAGGTLVAFATEPENVALDGDGSRNSPFTTALLNHIRKPGVEVEAMMKRVRGEVIQATRGKQTPWSNSSLTKDVFLVPGG